MKALFPLAAAVLLTVRVGAAEAGTPVLRPFALMGNPPPVQMIVPGFVARELPVQLTNINNLAYGPDGRLYAYAFDGKIHRLEDTDGDGLEDKASVFYANERGVIGTVGMRWGKDGLYVASRMQIMRLRDRGDGVAHVDVVASGWDPPDALSATSRYMDAYGLAVDKDGNVFFGLGISDIRNAYRLDPTTKQSKYSRTWDRGTVQQVTPQGRRSIFATGVRYTVSLAINAAGDLFATDQEGATWLFNGNPFDELLHIERARHYGFPPRHPVHLPHVIDEPSVFDYGPQHQATCSVHFNEAAPQQGHFGPEWWKGDALVAGSSRGRIYRTKLHKTDAGYVARNETIAHLSMLTIDALPTPNGDLIVCCHSGRPDWGTGPTGMGKIYKISYRDREAPQPVFAYPASPTETRVVFDRPIQADRFKDAATHAVLTMGEYVSGGDRFESMRPGYQAVKDQQKAPRYQFPILEAKIDGAANAIVLRTVPRTAALFYSVALRDGPTPRRQNDEAKRELWQHAAIDLEMDLSGVAATWKPEQGGAGWSGWLPHLDLGVARAFTAPSVEHARAFEHFRQRGTLELQAQLNLHSMLRPSLQPGTKIDYEWPPETVQVRFKSDAPVRIRSSGAGKIRQLSETEAELSVANVGEAWIPLTVTLPTGTKPPRLDVTWTTDEDARPRALPLRRVLLPWAGRQELSTAVGGKREIPEIAGGDWQRGRDLFHGKAACGTCHQVEGQGGALGPDLSNLVHRDYASVLQDIVEPNATLNPDYLTVTLQLKNKETVGGIMLQSWNNMYVLAQPNGEKLTIPRDDVEPGTTKPTGFSMMPPGLLEALNEQERKDLMTYLLMMRPAAKSAAK